jgi:hypothetical protein
MPGKKTEREIFNELYDSSQLYSVNEILNLVYNVGGTATAFNTHIVREGEDLQATINAVRQGDWLGYTRYPVSLNPGGFMSWPNHGMWFRIVVKGHATLPDSDETYEFTNDGVASIVGANAITFDPTDEFNEPDLAAGVVVTSVQGSGGNGAVVSNGMAVNINPDGGWKYFDYTSNLTGVTVSSDIIDGPWQYMETPITQTTILLYPGVYEGRIRLYKGIRLVGLDRDSCIIKCMESDKNVIYMDGHTGIENLTVQTTYDESYAPGTAYRAIRAGNLYENNEDILINNCRVIAQNYSINTAGGTTTTNLRVTNCKLSGSNALELFGCLIDCVFDGIIIRFTEQSAACHAAVDFDGGTNAENSRRCVFTNNNWIIERTNAGAAPYGINLSGWGHTVSGNTVRLISRNCNANDATQFLKVRYTTGITLPAGEDNFNPIFIGGNRFIFEIHGTVPSEITALIVGHTPSSPANVSGVVLADNTFACIPTEPVGKPGIKAWRAAGGTNPKVTVLKGGLGNWTGGANTLSNVDFDDKQ